MNYEWFQAINDLAGQSPLMDAILIFITKKALYMYALILLLMWFLGSERSKRTVVFAAITGALGLLINFIIGQIYFEPRPFVAHTVKLLVDHAADASFPSDHTTGAFSLSLAVLLLNRRIGSVMLALAVLTGFSRIYVGNHYPFDVLGSIVVSLVVSLAVYKLSPVFEPIARLIISIYNRIPFVPKSRKGLSAGQ